MVTLSHENGLVLLSCPVKSHTARRLPNEMSAFPGSFCTTNLPLDVLAMVLMQTSSVGQTLHCCIWGFTGAWHALHTFVESFQGQYKDGTNGSHDF